MRITIFEHFYQKSVEKDFIDAEFYIIHRTIAKIMNNDKYFNYPYLLYDF